MNAKTDVSLAIHESAHAATCTAQGGQVMSIDLRGRGETRVHYPASRNIWRKVAIGAMAGAIAQAKYLGEDDWKSLMSAEDHGDVERAAKQIGLSERVMDVFYESCSKEARWILERQEVADDVHSLTYRLLASKSRRLEYRPPATAAAPKPPAVEAEVHEVAAPAAPPVSDFDRLSRAAEYLWSAPESYP